MNIAIDTSPLGDKNSDRGVGKYTETLLEVLQEYCPDIRVTEVAKGATIKADTDVVHYPYFDPFFLTLPFIKHFHTVVTVHDLTPLVFPDHFPRGLKGEIKWQLQKISLRSVDRIITDSNSSKNDIEKFTKISKGNIDVVHIAPSKIYKPVAIHTAGVTVRSICPKVYKYILYVGDINWNKNIEGIVRSFALISKTHPMLKLVLIGKVFTENDHPEMGAIFSLIKSLCIQDRVVMPGFVSSEMLRSFYSLALCLVFPSFYEGYGLPPLEAMSCGCPVVLGNKGSLPEIHGNETLVNPYSIESIAMGIRQAIKKDTAMDKHRRIAWAKTFSRKRMAYETKAAYEKVLA